MDTTERYIDLAGGIVRQAMIDYKNALLNKDAKSKRLSELSKRRITECERFFLSAWGQFLSANHGEYIIERCRKEVAQEEEKRKKKR